MVKRHIGVLPYRRALTVEEAPGCLNLLSSVEPPGAHRREGRKSKKKKKRAEQRIARIRCIPFAEDEREELKI